MASYQRGAAGHHLKTLLVGGLGFIGKHIIRALAQQCTLTVLSNAKSALRNAEFAKTYDLCVEIGDITDGPRVKEVMGRHMPDAVVHLAALTGIAKCNENPYSAFSVNVLGTYNVIMGCEECNSKLIFLSSREVYGDTRSDRTREDDPLIPNNTYGITKMLGERLVVWAASTYGLDYTILRLTNVYGPEGDQYNVQAIIRKALSERRIQILGGSQLVNPTYVEDVAEVVRRCLIDSRTSRQTLNVSSKEDMTVEEMVSRIVSVLDAPINVERAPMRVGETLVFRPSVEKLEKVLGYCPPTTFAEGLQKTVSWYRNKK